VDAFLDQYKEFDALDKDFSGAVAIISKTAHLTHPWTVVRAYELNKWARSGEYDMCLGTGRLTLPEPVSARLTAASILPFECPICVPSRTVTADFAECPDCGCPMTDRNRFRPCVRCGVSNKPSHQFCESCGFEQLSNKEEYL
ncbi:MAG: hypothetical protein FWD57_08420, partial [Polyangiaceae bacterium]|nr:hypothetical protein [Polyangiaceae bacterium]